MIYLIGVNHGVQDYRWKQYAALIEEFQAYLYAAITNYKITRLAEEYNEDYLEGKNPNSVLKDISESSPHKLPHLYCDPNTAERQSIGMPSDEEMEEEALKSFNLSYRSFKAFIVSEDFDRELFDKLKKQKKLIGKRYWPLREQFWLDKVKRHIDENILFIVGACHIESFSDLIKHNGCKFSVINEDWNKEKFPPDDC
ncbi:MAG: hypothetical protein LUQ65_12785 [Candidatus Helarchaeota archaeon]|nr:hypothetical protein [Candidatus Helarchaeota archaeon]